MVDFPRIPDDLIQQLRGIFFAKDRSPILSPNNWMGLPLLESTPTILPSVSNYYFYFKTGGGLYRLDWDGNEVRLDGLLSLPEHDHSSSTEGGSVINLAAGNQYQIDNNYINYITAAYMNIPGLVGFWPMSAIQPSTGNVPNLVPIVSGATNLSLVNNNSVKIQHYNNLIPYADFDGVNQYFSIADDTDLDITGAEDTTRGSWAGVPGLTMGGWFWVNTLAAIRGLMTKDNGGAQRSYTLYADPVNNRIVGFVFGAGTDGIVLNNVFSTLNQWVFCVLRWIPSTSIKVFANSQTNSAAAANAVLTNTTASFVIGGFSGGALFLPGRASLCFLCANALPDALINSLYQQSRPLFGV